MTYTFKEVCQFLNEQYNFSTVSKSFAKKTRKAGKQLGLVLCGYGANTIRLRRADHSTTTYTDISDPDDHETQTIILTHALLTTILHEPERNN